MQNWNKSISILIICKLSYLLLYFGPLILEEIDLFE